MGAAPWGVRLVVGAVVATAIAGGGSVASAANGSPCRAGELPLLVCSAPGAAGAVVLDEASVAAEAAAGEPQPTSVVTAEVAVARAPVLPLIVTVPPVNGIRISRPVVSKGVAARTWKAPVTVKTVKAPGARTSKTSRRPARS